jgi:hypothetical protein
LVRTRYFVDVSRIRVNTVLSFTFGLRVYFLRISFVKFHRNVCALKRDAKVCPQQFPFVTAATAIRFPTGKKDGAGVCRGVLVGEDWKKERLFPAQI